MLPPPVSSTRQVTAVLLLPLTVALNCWLPPGLSVTEAGVMLMRISLPGLTVKEAALLLVEPSELLTSTL